ncbi:hypothetical protein [Flavobacterium kingsejongi]|uniref:Oxidase n=1 Tax=Flavobacterium kingsejongi TaxID=1678728 RepID=A0A2S1LMB4_9FLAO|nr:hypothetical protein [Flavobacterium kingsejongi]AWG24828.1 hypothetical protein FK004_06085 [Flavobacterium kingsejongi]
MPTDLKLTQDLDIEIINGDFMIGESSYQHQKTLILSDKGEFKEYPMRGVAARRYLEDGKPDDLAREIRQEYVIDGMLVNTLKIGNGGQIEVDAFYTL